MNSQIIIRPATVNDQGALDNLLSYEFFIHQHLDWRPVLDWLGFQPFYIATRNDEAIACLAAPSEVKGVAWVRLFACSSLFSRDEMWDILFEKILSSYQKIEMIAVLGIEKWFVNLLLKKSYVVYQNIIVYERMQSHFEKAKNDFKVIIRQARLEDLFEIAQLDSKCFAPLWQLSEEPMQKAYYQSGYVTLAEYQGKIIGYQITTETFSNAHLARLAVDPDYQGKNVGKVILSDLFNHYQKLGIQRITVNTQDDNVRSKALYEKMGFIKTQDGYPVLIYKL